MGALAPHAPNYDKRSPPSMRRPAAGSLRLKKKSPNFMVWERTLSSYPFLQSNKKTKAAH